MRWHNFSKNPLSIITLCGFMERFSNFGLFTVLVLKLKQEFNVPDDIAYTIFGLFLSISYGSLMIGGFCADRWFGIRKAIIIGALLLILGNVCLAVKNLYIFYLGLSIVTLGIALFKVNCASLVGRVYQDRLEKKEKGFTIYYCGMNIGAVTSPIIFGFIAKIWGWSSCFYINTVLLIITLVMFLINRSIKDMSEKAYNPKVKIYISLIMVCILGTTVYLYPYKSSIALIFLFIINIIFFLKLISQQEKNIKKHLAGILLINFCSVFFFVCSLQVTSSITLFVDRDISKHIFGLDIPTAAFSSLDPLFVVVMAPFFLWFWKKSSSLGYECYLTTKMAFGILCAAIAFVALYLSAQTSLGGDVYLSLFWLVIANILLGGGEVCIVPPIFTAISRYSPENLKSTMIGSWYLFVAIAGFFAGQLSRLTSATNVATNKILTVHIYSSAFIIIGCIALVSTMLVYFLRPMFSKLFES